MQLRYEDFMKRPRQTIEAILQLVDEPTDKLPFVDDDHIELKQSHVCMGNYSRFKKGVIALRFDDAWKRDMRRSTRLLVTSLTWPMILRYGYWQS